jgi:hypothetical protein
MVTKLQQKGKAAQLMNRNAQQLFGNWLSAHTWKSFTCKVDLVLVLSGLFSHTENMSVGYALCHVRALECPFHMFLVDDNSIRALMSQGYIGYRADKFNLWLNILFCMWDFTLSRRVWRRQLSRVCRRVVSLK